MKEKFVQLEKFDTPSITNVIATYPDKADYCLGLYHPWNSNWYTDQSLKCMFPELGPKVGKVVTVVYGMPDSSYNRLSFEDLLLALDEIKEPIILAVKQNFPDHIKEKNGLMGGNMLSAFKSMGVVGVLSDGPSRDVDEIRPMGVQYMLTGVTAGHGPFTIEAINVPVDICGMDLIPGELVHMDENGAVKFPEKYLDDVIENVQKLNKIETEKQELLRSTNDPKKLARIMKGIYD